MTSNAGEGNRILGSLRSAGGAGIVRIEERYDTDIDDLWSALTDPARLARWHGEVEGVVDEVIVVDNGSSDGSQAIASAHGARVIDETTRGYGSALRRGCDEARGRFLVMGDADASYDFSEIGPFLDALQAGGDLVLGSRTRGSIDPGAMPWKNRYIGNPVSTKLL